jgi:hypothetical protein
VWIPNEDIEAMRRRITERNQPVSQMIRLCSAALSDRRKVRDDQLDTAQATFFEMLEKASFAVYPDRHQQR